jgi:hypothetical protein
LGRVGAHPMVVSLLCVVHQGLRQRSANGSEALP